MIISNKVLQRDNVNEELNNILNFPVTVITAPMGYGKTTAVKNYLLINKISHIWIPLSESSKDTDLFWAMLAYRVSGLDSDIGNALKRFGFPKGTAQIDRMISEITNSLEKDLVIVFDDYQYAETDELNNLLKSVIIREIPNIHIVIISRNTLKIDFTEFTVKNLIYEIDESTLRFSDLDVKHYFECLSMPLKEDKITQVQKLADGWPAAIYLIYRSLNKGIPLENITEIHALIKSAIYEHYDNETKRILCLLSLFDTFTIDLASYATEIETIGDVINMLHRENALINFDKRSKSYTIHNVFRNFLTNESKKINIDTKKIYNRAGSWYIEKGDIIHGFLYYSKAENYQAILTEFEKSSFNIKENITSLILEIFDKISFEDKERHPIAYLKYIMVLIIYRDKKLGDKLLKQFENKLNTNNYINEDLKEIKAVVHFIKIFLSFNDIEQMLYHVDAALDLLSDEFFLGSPYQGLFFLGSPHLSCLYYKEPGIYRKITEMPIEKCSRLLGGVGFGSREIFAAEYALETGDFDTVEENALKAIYKAKTKNQTSIILCASFALARLYIYQSKYLQAIKALNELYDEVLVSSELILMNEYDLCMGYIYACSKEYEKIPRWIKEGDMLINSPLVQYDLVSYIVYGKSLILSEDWIKAEALCETFNQYFSIYNNQLAFIHNYIHLAIATFYRGNEEKSKYWLKKALIISQADCIIMPYVENGNKLIPILNKIRKDGGINMKYLSQIIEEGKKYMIKIPEGTLKNLLSSREIEVLICISKGKKRLEIAEKLFISPGTVRTHIQNIYKKLEVNNKVDAINKATYLKII